MKPLVSVIVPIYKVEKYLSRCLDSLNCQTLSNIEIILIDDASPDNSGIICEAYAAKDSRFKVFHNEENKGLSAVRNIGVQLANSDYIMFVDSDDWASEDFCQVAYECATQQQVDLVMFSYQRVTENEPNDLVFGFVNKVSQGLKTKEETIELTFESFGMVAWNKLYHKKLFNSVTYPEGDLFEDTATTYKLIWNASGIYCIDKVLYYHLCARPGSIMSNIKTTKAIKDMAKVHLRHSCDLYNWGYRSKKLISRLNSAALHYCIVNKKDYFDQDYLIAEKILKVIQGLSKENSWKAGLLIKLFQTNRKLFDLVCTLLGKRVT